MSNPSSSTPSKVARTPLPKLQLTVLTYMQFAEPITATIIYPYVIQLIRETGITGGDERKVGHYAGVIEATFFVSEASTTILWGRASDRVGRKPILLLAMFGSAIAIIVFGLSTNFWVLLIARAGLGASNGAIGVCKAVIAEITDSTNIAKAISLSPIMWSAGVTLGPALGGILARPADRWPNGIGKIHIVQQLPYLLPSLVAAMIPISAFVFAALYLKETLASAIRRKQQRKARSLPPSESDPLLNSESSEPEAAPPTIRALMTYRIINPLVNFAFLAFSNMVVSALQPLQWSTPVSLGGLGLTSATIGTALAIEGVGGGICSILFFEPLVARWGTWRVYTWSIFAQFPVMAAFPVMNALAVRAGKADLAVFVVMGVQLVLCTTTYLSFSCMFIYFTDVAPSRSSLGTINGMAQVVGSTVRAFAPVVASSLFAISLQFNVLHGTMVYWILSLFVLAGFIGAFKLPRRLSSDTHL